jgi:hypothetical protein
MLVSDADGRQLSTVHVHESPKIEILELDGDRTVERELPAASPGRPATSKEIPTKVSRCAWRLRTNSLPAATRCIETLAGHGDNTDCAGEKGGTANALRSQLTAGA